MARRQDGTGDRDRPRPGDHDRARTRRDRARLLRFTAAGALTRGLALAAAAVGSTLLLAGAAPPAPQAPAPAGDTQPAEPARERAWRANNVGVAHLEQFNFDAATAAFNDAVAIDPSLAIARLNLGIARFYAGDLAGARAALEAARPLLPDRPQPDYVLGLVARAENRTEDAIAAFSRVRTMDPDDVGTAINLGQLYLQDRQYPEAVERFTAALAAEPYNATAAYGLSTAMTRSRAPGAEEATARFQTLRTSAYAVTYSQNYLEQGRYAEGIASTGSETGLVDTAVPDVSFQEMSNAIAVTPPQSADAGSPALALADLDGDGHLDLVLAGPGGLRLLRNDGQARFAPLRATIPAAVQGAARAALAADYDNDGAVDLLVLRTSGLSLLHRTAPDRFEDATSAAGLAGVSGHFTTAAWVDADHDGDLDLAIGGEPGARLLRNNGDRTFADVTAASGLPGSGGVAAIVPSDFDNRRDVDLLLVRAGAPAALFSNRRDGSFADVAGEAGLAATGAAMAAAADLNKDGATDFLFAQPDGPVRLALSDGRGRFSTAEGPAESAGARALLPIDYDNDGLTDLVVLTATGLRVLRGVGSGYADVTGTALPATTNAGGAGALAAGDLDGDGDTDLVLQTAAGPRVWRNEGGSRHASLRVALRGRVSNRSGAGVKVELRAGSLRSRLETSITTPAAAPADVLFGLGRRSRADAVRVLWPSGILQAETGIGDAAAPLAGAMTLEELDRKPSSCPFLYTWNGTRFEFVTDFLGGGEMGYWLAPGTRNEPIPAEYVRIPGDRLVPRNGRLELRVTNELEEALFLDRLRLIAVDHPDDLAVYPNGGLRERPEPFTLYATRAPQALAAAVDDRGRDVLERLSAVDRRFVDDLPLDPIRGYAARHALTLTLPAAPDGRRLLLLTGWTDYAFSRDNVAASQRGLALTPPSLEIPDGRGGWRTLVEDIGFPAGRPQTVTLDLTGRLPRGVTDVRIVTTMRIYWDQIVVGASEASVTPRLTPLDPLSAALRWRGFSKEGAPDGREPWTYDYDRVSTQSPWKLFPGRYTREGDVRPLLTSADDMFVVSKPGDEIAVSFDAGELPALPAGWTRTWLLYGDGFSKEMDLHSASPDTLDPLPFHAMSRYPYSTTEAYPSSEAHREYQARYNTRIVARPLPPLELAGRER
jgi:tetratricopeptide (TPR) repeat protein